MEHPPHGDASLHGTDVVIEITACIPSIPPRVTMLTRSIDSVVRQSFPVKAVSVALDTTHKGAAATRQSALDPVQTEWVAFIDDDDWMYPNHLEVLSRAAVENNADYVFSYYMVHDAQGNVMPDVDPLTHFGRSFDPTNPHQTTITTLVRTELAKSVGFYKPVDGQTVDGQTWGEDYQFTLGCVAAGAKIIHVPERTWAWCHHEGNTSGRSDRW